MAEDITRDDTSSGPAMPAEPKVGSSTVLNFTVDAALLQELGERLVGKPFTALAELVKNSYDADAEHVVIRFGEDEIEVSDDGHGMDYEAFVKRWMRVGSPHKRALETSPEKKRPLTGSKGVGRLAAQFLSSSLTVISTPKGDSEKHLEVEVDWQDIPSATDLQDVSASLKMVAGTSDYPNDSEHGTRIIMRGLRQLWSSEELRELAKELWFLQPPDEIGGDFKVEVESADWTLAEEFDTQMRAILEVWDARIVGKTEGTGEHRCISVFVKFRDGTIAHAKYRDAHDPEGKLQFQIEDVPDSLKFDIRVYNLKYRQPEGIGVKEARSYMNEYGGVHIYDGGFRLPHYGPETDWLEIEFDHSHRLSRSRLLPAELHISEALNNLPTNSRLLGSVYVQTGHEQARGIEEPLSIAITRDRLTENSAYEALRKAVRWAIDYYAVELTKQRIKETEKHVKTAEAKGSIGRVEATVEGLKDKISPPAFKAIQKSVQNAKQAVAAEKAKHAAQTSLMATLATAGMAALAYEHETSKQLQSLEHLADDLEGIRGGGTDVEMKLKEASSSIREWVQKTRELRGLFGHLMDERNREVRGQLRVAKALDTIIRQLSPILRNIEVDVAGVDRQLRFPEASLAELTAIFQNILVNAVNATLDSQEPRIRIRTHDTNTRTKLFVEDTGVGVDLDEAEVLFEPFERRLELSDERRNLGLGGTGLGLTIVRTICEKIGCKVRFVEPEPGFATSIEISWEKED